MAKNAANCVKKQTEIIIMNLNYSRKALYKLLLFKYFHSLTKHNDN